MIKKILTLLILSVAVIRVCADGFTITYDFNSCADAYVTMSSASSNTMTLHDAIDKINNDRTQQKTIQKIVIRGELSVSDMTALAEIQQEHVDLSLSTIPHAVNHADSLAFIKQLPPAYVKYIILPNNASKRLVDEVGESYHVAVSKSATMEETAAWVYTDRNGKDYIYSTEASLGSTNVTMTFNVPLTDVSHRYTMDGAEYTDAVYFDSNGNAYAPTSSATIHTLTDHYNYSVNGVLYTNKVRHNADGTRHYGYIGANITEVALDLGHPVKYYYTDGVTKYVYEGEVTETDGKLTGDINGQQVDVYAYISDYATYYYISSDGTATAYNGRVYQKSQGKYVFYGRGIVYDLVEGEKYIYTQSGTKHIYDGIPEERDGKWYGTIDGEEVELTLETTLFYTKEGKEVIPADAARITIDRTCYCEGGTEIALSVAYEANVYTVDTANGTQIAIYEGYVYGNVSGYIGGGSDVELELSKHYFYADGTEFTGYINEQYNPSTTGFGTYTVTGIVAEEAQSLASSYSYEYFNPATGNTETLTETHRLTSHTISANVAVVQKNVLLPSATKLHLTAYVSKPGTLYMALARWAELGNNTAYYASVGNVTALTLSGSVNYSDIGTSGNNMSQYGHVEHWDSDNKSDVIPDCTAGVDFTPAQYAMNGNSLTYLNLEDAVFHVQTDMQPSRVNLKLETVILPTAESMTLIPDRAFNNLHHLGELCIPHNFKVIGSGAFYNTHSLQHIYTTRGATDHEKTITDHGPNTFTFSSNLEQIEGADVAKSGDNATFFGNGIVTDIYVLATKAPKCGPGTFAAYMTYGWNGFAGDLAHPIGRHNYVNGDSWFVVLHYPKDCQTNGEDKNYTDITRVYTLNDETGAVDAQGKPMKWPKHTEFGKAYQTAVKGTLWDGTTTYDTQYQGWHEISLAGSSITRDYNPQEENAKFVQRDWLSICIPYDLKASQVLAIFGVDPTKTANGQDTVELLDGTEVTVTKPLYPTVTTLTHVSRSVNSRRMILHFKDVIKQDREDYNNLGNPVYYDININEPHGQGYTEKEFTTIDPVIMKGGHPYLIKPYLPKDWNGLISNIGMYAMSVAADLNDLAARKGESAPYVFNESCKLETWHDKINLPCLKHRVHAFNKDSGVSIVDIPAEGNNEVFSYQDIDRTNSISYNFIGTYTQTTIPQYSYYIGKATDGTHKFSRTTKTTFIWKPYSAVILPLADDVKYNEADLMEHASSNSGDIHNIVVNTGTRNDDLVIFEGENATSAGTKLIIGFDEKDNAGETTGIVEIETQSAVRANDNKVYSINGQYMGTDTDRLTKGIYVVGGRKVVVR